MGTYPVKRVMWIGHVVKALKDMDYGEGLVIRRRDSRLGDGTFLVVRARSWENSSVYVLYKKVDGNASFEKWVFQRDGEYWALVAAFTDIPQVIFALFGTDKINEYVNAEISPIPA
jgi:hypothetical protein